MDRSAEEAAGRDLLIDVAREQGTDGQIAESTVAYVRHLENMRHVQTSGLVTINK